MATSVVVDFQFDFARAVESLTVEIPLSGSLPDSESRLLQRLILECPDLSDEDDLEELGWELEDAIQYKLIMPRVSVSNFQIDPGEDKISFRVALALWGKEFSGQDFFHDFSDSGLTEDSSPQEFEDFVSNEYYGSHHYFDVTSLELTVLP